MGEQFPNTLNLKGRRSPSCPRKSRTWPPHHLYGRQCVSPGSAGVKERPTTRLLTYSDLHSVFLKNSSYAEFDFKDGTTEIR